MNRTAIESQQGHVSSTGQMPADESVRQALRAIGTVRTYFLHHSVGDNVLRGLTRLANDLGETLPPFVQIEDDPIPAGSMLASEAGGSNMDPHSKITAFANSLRTNCDLQPDIAFMKLCYADFGPETDDVRVFENYFDVMNQLKRECRDTVVAHVTVPLYVKSDSLKDRIKRLIGREVWADASNARRNDFNERMRREFSDSPVFDIARIQSTKPNGAREVYTMTGKQYFSMFPGYSFDGGHLNQHGERRTARMFVRFLASVMSDWKCDAPRVK